MQSEPAACVQNSLATTSFCLGRSGTGLCGVSLSTKNLGKRIVNTGQNVFALHEFDTFKQGR